MLYGYKGANELAADLVIASSTDTYVCMIDPTKVNRAAGALPIEQQTCWQITKYHTETSGETTRQTALYPNGSNAFDFAPSSIDDYTFTYRL